MKLKGVIQDLKIKKIKKLNNDSKNISRTFSGLLWAVWDQFIFKQFLDPAYISQELQAPSYVVCTIYRVLIYCNCHFHEIPSVLASSVCWSLQRLTSALTQGGGGGHFFRLTCSVVLWGGRDAANE